MDLFRIPIVTGYLTNKYFKNSENMICLCSSVLNVKNNMKDLLSKSFIFDKNINAHKSPEDMKKMLGTVNYYSSNSDSEPTVANMFLHYEDESPIIDARNKIMIGSPPEHVDNIITLDKVSNHVDHLGMALSKIYQKFEDSSQNPNSTDLASVFNKVKKMYFPFLIGCTDYDKWCSKFLPVILEFARNMNSMHNVETYFILSEEKYTVYIDNRIKFKIHDLEYVIDFYDKAYSIPKEIILNETQGEEIRRKVIKRDADKLDDMDKKRKREYYDEDDFSVNNKKIKD